MFPVLYYNYWCASDKEKNYLQNLIKNNEKKIEKLKGKIQDLTQDIKGMSAEIKDRREKLEKEGENKEYEKDIAFDVKHITKNQIKRDKLAREVHREEILHASKQNVRESRERHRNEGMDR